MNPLAARAVVTASVDRFGESRRRALRQRLATVARTLRADSVDLETISTRRLLDAVETAMTDASAAEVWLALAVLRATLPDTDAVVRAKRRLHLEGPRSVLAAMLRPPLGNPRDLLEFHGWRTVSVVCGEVLVDIHHTAETGLATGIQRVVRQTTAIWLRDHNPRFVAWQPGYRTLRELSDGERAAATDASSPGRIAPVVSDEVVVPWRCTYVLPELSTEGPRNHRIQALARFSGCQTAMIGYDCVPISSAETAGEGMGGAFAVMLSAAAFFNRISTTSLACTREYSGWRSMLGGCGLPGPGIACVGLPAEIHEPTQSALEEASRLMRVDGLPMMLCVGSHEPRKNHLAVLHAAELLWREGHEFSLMFIGGRGWKGERFANRLRELQAGGRPVSSVRAVSDDVLWAAYRLAHCVVFPSLNEGYGLPVAESLAAGTPVITSAFGSMREIAEPGGALLVNPRDDHDVRDAMRSMLVDRDGHARLAAAARSRRFRSWEDYAAEAWAFLADGRTPDDDGDAASPTSHTDALPTEPAVR